MKILNIMVTKKSKKYFVGMKKRCIFASAFNEKDIVQKFRTKVCLKARVL